MEDIRQNDRGESYFTVPKSWEQDLNNWKMLPDILDGFMTKDMTIYVEMENVMEMSSGIFNLLFNLVTQAGKKQAKLIFIGVNEKIEERVGLLGISSE